MHDATHIFLQSTLVSFFKTFKHFHRCGYLKFKWLSVFMCVCGDCEFALAIQSPEELNERAQTSIY